MQHITNFQTHVVKSLVEFIKLNDRIISQPKTSFVVGYVSYFRHKSLL